MANTFSNNPRWALSTLFSVLLLGLGPSNATLIDHNAYGGSRITVDQTCYDRNQTLIQIQFDLTKNFDNNDEKTTHYQAGHWIGIYPVDFAPHEEPLYWVYKCGSDQGCNDDSNETQQRGSISIHTTVAKISSGRYVAVLAHDGPDSHSNANNNDDKDNNNRNNENDDYQILATSQAFTVAPRQTMCDVRQQTHRQLQSAEMSDVIRAARRDIIDIVEDDETKPGQFLRMIFHDCVGGRCDGCINMNNPDHAGIPIAMDALEDVVDRYEEDGLTRADIWALAAFVGVERSMPSDDRIDFPFFYYGRKVCPMSRTGGPDFEMCHPDFSTSEVLRFFEEEFDFSPMEVAAIMGGHTIGVFNRENSGFDGEGGWVAENLVFDNGFHQALVGKDGDPRRPPGWNQEFVRNRGPLPDRWQWQARASPTHPDKKVVMLNSDVALVKELGSRNMDSDGRVDCRFTDKDGDDGCTRARDSIFDPMVLYAQNNRAFLRDFHRALEKMVNVGYRVDEDTCDVNGVCKLQLR